MRHSHSRAARYRGASPATPKRRSYPGSHMSPRRLLAATEPWFHRRETKFRRSERPLVPIKFLAIVGIVLFWAALLLWLPFFQITNVEWQGLKTISTADALGILEHHWSRWHHILPERNYFLNSPAALAEQLRLALPIISVRVQKTFPKSVSIEIQERISSLIYRLPRAVYILDSQGQVIKKIYDLSPSSTVDSALVVSIATSTGFNLLVPTTTAINLARQRLPLDIRQARLGEAVKLQIEFGPLPVLYDDRDVPGLGLSPETVSGAIKFFESSAKLPTEQGSISFLTLTEEKFSLNAITKFGWQIIFNPIVDNTEPLARLRLFLEKTKPQEYVDVRFGNRIYWK